MFFILRMVFWVAVVALLLPAPPGGHDMQAPANLSANLVADKAVSTVLSYCTSSPQQCAAGLVGAKRLSDLLTGQNNDAETPAPAPLAQRFTALPPRRPAIP